MTSSVVSTRPTSKGSALITKHGQKVAHVFFFSFSFVYNNPHSFYHQARDSLFSYYFYIKKKKKKLNYIYCVKEEKQMSTPLHKLAQKKKPTKGKENKPGVSALTSKKGLARIAHFSKFLMHSIHVTM